MRLAVVASHPIQYYSPLFRELARRLDLTVYYAHRATPEDQGKAGFDVAFEWDTDLLTGYSHEFLRNSASQPSLDRFGGCDTPEIAEKLRKGRFDAVMVLGWHRKSFVQAIVGAKRAGVPVLVRGDSHLGTPRSWAKRAGKAIAYPPLLRMFSAALYVGKHSYDYWVHYGFPQARLFSSPHCVDTEMFAKHATDEARVQLRNRLAIAPDARVALFAGKLLSFKRPLDLVAAVRRLADRGQNVVILVAGSGPLQEELISAAREAKVDFHFLGFCNQSEMPAVYAASDVLVLPSDGRETWGLVANEAIACGRPIILSDAVGSAPDLVADTSVGRTFPVGNIEALAESIERVFELIPSREALARKSQAHSIAVAATGIVEALEFVRHGRSAVAC